MVASEKQILAEVPSSQEGKVRDVEVLSSASISEATRFRFRLGSQIRLVSGFPKLVQCFMRILLQSPGSSLLYPGGGGLLALIRSPHAPRDQKAVTSEVHRAVSQTAEGLVSQQARQAGLSRVERLAYANLASCGVSGGRIYMEIEIGNQAGVTGRSLLDLVA